MQQIPIQPIPAQSLKLVLAQQNCQIGIYSKPQGIFVDVNVDGVDHVNYVVARNMVPLVCREYLGFSGNLYFMDTQGISDPVYTGLNTRFVLLYFTAEEYAFIKANG